MKPLYIEMRAFGSYQEEAIDFEGIDHGLFLITGDTGAGKTTIFDAITYALYGETSGGKRDGRMMRSQYAPENIRTEVKFRFLYGGQEYTVIRSPEQPNWKKDKTTGIYKQLKGNIKPSVELILPDGASYPGKIREVDNKIAEIIGLSCSQFTQIAMLAQGDFMKLLHASSEERKDIFAKIFDTRIYGLMEAGIKRRFDTIDLQRETNRAEIKRELEQIRCVEDSELAGEWTEGKYREHFSESDREGILEFVRQICEETDLRRQGLQEARRKNEAALAETAQRLQQDQAVNQLFAELRDTEKAMQNLQEKTDEMEALRNQVSRGLRANDVWPVYVDFVQKQKNREECKRRSEQLSVWIAENRERVDFLSRQADEAKKRYEADSPQLHAQIHQIRQNISRYEEIESLTKARTDVAAQIAALSEALGKLEKARERYAQEQERLSGELNERRAKAANLEVLDLKIEGIKKEREELLEIRESMSEIDSIEQNLRQREKAHTFMAGRDGEELCAGIVEPALVTTNRTNPGDAVRGDETDNAGAPGYEAEYIAGSGYEADGNAGSGYGADGNAASGYGADHTEESGYEADGIAGHGDGGNVSIQIAILRNRLRDGEPCPVCGRIHHSSAAIEARVADLDEALGELLKTRNNAAENLRLMEETEHSLKAAAKQTEKCGEAIQRKTDSLVNLKIEKSRQETSLKYLREELAWDSRAQAEEELHRKEGMLHKLETAQRESAAGYGSLKGQMDSQQGKLAQEQQNFLLMEQAETRAAVVYKEALAAAGFSDKEELLAARLDSREIAEFQKRVKDYEIKTQVTANDLKRLQRETEGKTIVDTLQYEEEQAQLISWKEKLERQDRQLHTIAENNRSAYNRARDLYQKREKIDHEHQILRNLNDTANGRKHMKFQTYVQRYFFKTIINSANKRLYKMAGSQFILQCRDVKDLGKQGYVGLELDVYSLVNEQCRDVKTLSGGESFMAALAMALGMADVIQNSTGSVHIDTMFIDEGFGSLSEETRNQAIAILNELSGGKRLVGIISHVSELKAQVDTKLVVTKTDKGSKAQWES